MKLKVPYPKRRFKIPSKSEPGHFHIVELWSDGSLECDCVAGSYKRECRHKKFIKEHLKLFGEKYE
jgi:hypothetical protein